MDHEGDMAGRVAGGVDGLDAREHFFARCEKGDAVLQRGHPVLRADNEALAVLRHRSQRVVGTPEIPFRARHPGCGLGEGEIVEIVENAPQMIGMRVGEDEVGDLGGVHAGLLQPGEKLARGRQEIRPGPGIEKRQPVAGAQQGDVAVRLVVGGRHAAFGEKGGALLDRYVGKDGAQRQVHVTVADDGDLAVSGRQRSGGKYWPGECDGGGGCDTGQNGATCGHERASRQHIQFSE